MNKEILRLAVPNIISNVSVPLLSTVDTALMGHLSQAHLGAVGLGAMVFNLIYWNFGFLRMGTTGLTAQAFGAQDKAEMARLLGRSFLVAMTIALLLILLQGPFEKLGLWFFEVDEDQVDLVSSYFRIRIWAAPATLLSYVVFGWLFGMQNAIIPLVLTIAANMINIVLSYILVQHYHLGIAGAAWGTVVAQYAGVLLAFAFLWLRYPAFVRTMGKNLFDHVESLVQFFSVNRDLFIRTLCLTLAFAFFYRQSSINGATILAVNVVLLQLINWMSYGIDGFAYAAESLVGKYKGRADHQRGNLAIKRVMFWGLSLALIFSLTYALWSVPIFQIFTDQNQVIQASKPYLWYMAAFPLAGFICYIWDGIYIGLTASITMRNAMLLSLVIYLAAYYSLEPFAPVHALWIALLLFLLVRGIIQSVYFYRFGWDIH